ncbi:MAG: hypothetical protein ABW085_05880 [Sedimenticola sp.]
MKRLNSTCRFFSFLAGLSAAFSLMAFQTPSVKACQLYKDKIEYYSELIRTKEKIGIKVSTLELWTKKREEFSNLFTEYKCPEIRARLN